ncbi:hypothetical protein AJ79_03791 [Helicocarpus griseus UAMH5409]|uniref:Uncharacterized protein n=1 Tax=Helicocarpus griseus UAMH5409 TaxID=1447875 RepID=A0A2B7XWR6_9EURO|nr:hypothetical protein AJ79_03791 [Helicocarpus griseus UAMH5409]
MSAFKFTFSTQPLPPPPSLSTTFAIKANPSTDTWSKPPSTHRFNAPILHKTGPLASFKRASVHISAQWSNLYDQGGLILVLNYADGTKKWVKTGIEFVNGKPHVSTVAKDNWADWSLLEIPGGGGEAKIEMVREGNGLWVYLVEEGEGGKKAIREVTWALVEEGVTEAWVGVYAARPAKEGGELVVEFKGLEVEFAE